MREAAVRLVFSSWQPGTQSLVFYGGDDSIGVLSDKGRHVERYGILINEH